MENDRTLAIVVGYHECSYPPAKAYDAGLLRRFAVVFDTDRLDKGYMFFDADLFIRILEGICQVIVHDTLAIEMSACQRFRSIGELSAWYCERADDDRDPPTNVTLYVGDRMAALAETEEWAMVGGPAPYHDSYTLSFYTQEDRSEEFGAICERISKDMGTTITGTHHAPRSKEPFTPLWKTPLKWLGVKRW